MTTARKGMSLIEVVLAMGLIAIGVIAVAMALPAAMRVQERTRFQLYAAGKGLELVDRFLGDSIGTDAGGGFTMEASRPWNTPAGRRNFDPDLEIRAAVQRGSLFPVPRDIAYRIDSPDNEIRRILDAGGQLYYSNPTSAHPLKPDGPLQPRPPNEAMRMVIAVAGDPQQNAIQHYPWKGVPYYVAYPSPPVNTFNAGTDWEWWKYVKGEALEYYAHDQDGDGKPDADPDLESLWWCNLREAAGGTFDYDGQWAWVKPDHSGMRVYTTLGTFDGLSGNNMGDKQGEAIKHISESGWNRAKCNLVLALWYGWRKGLPANVLYGRATAADIATIAADPKKIRAMRYLAFAGGCMTKWFPLDPEPARAAKDFQRMKETGWYAPEGENWVQTVNMPARSAHDGLRQGVLLPGDDVEPGIPGMVWPLSPSPTLKDLISKANLPNGPGANPFEAAAMDALPAGHPALTDAARSGHFSGGANNGHMAIRLAMIQNWHETCLASAMRYATTNPYDWSEPRPYERQLFTDHPLMQWDICAPTTDQLTSDADGILGTKSDPNLGGQNRIQAKMWRPVAAQSITNQGLNSHDQALASDPAMDYGTIKGDATRFNLTMPFDPTERCRQLVFWAVDWTSYEDWETAIGAPVDAARYPRWHNNDANSKITDLMQLNGNEWYDAYMPLFRNPEKSRLFVLDQAGTPTGATVLYYTAGLDGGHDVSQTERSAYIFRAETGWDMRDQRVDLGAWKSRLTLGGQTLPDDHPRRVFLGLYGADRNGNGRLDRGPLPASVRLRAQEITRLNFYDPRLGFTLR